MLITTPFLVRKMIGINDVIIDFRRYDDIWDIWLSARTQNNKEKKQ